LVFEEEMWNFLWGSNETFKCYNMNFMLEMVKRFLFFINFEHQVPRVRISGVIPLLPSVPSWHIRDFTFSNLGLPPCSASQN